MVYVLSFGIGNFFVFVSIAIVAGMLGGTLLCDLIDSG